MKKRDTLVHYDPGDAPGSPAGLPEAQAEKQLEQDTAYLQLMQKVGTAVTRWPAITRTPKKQSRR